MAKFTKEDALRYHEGKRPGKIEVIPTKPHSTQLDLSLAYSPGVAEPCLEIEADPNNVYKYTAKGNLVAVISNGTAILGLGDLGAEAGKPVMEGKGLLFKIFADIDVFDIEVDSKNVDEFVKIVKGIAPTFGGINLEDIKAPECFEIEDRLKKELDIPIMHDDQHGTAIISAAGLLNAVDLQKKKLSDIKIVVNGAGASAVACTRLYIALGVKKKNIIMLDSKGVIHKSRTDLSTIKKEFATSVNVKTLEDAVEGADMFLGLSVANVLKPSMVNSMADKPIVFALANPNPEIAYELAMKTRKDLVMATGRSDHPNQVNNVLGFPFIFRGALDVKATGINEEMKIAAVKALAALAKEDVPDIVNTAYHEMNLTYGKDYIIPKPLDPRLLTVVAPAVAKAAMDSGVAKAPIHDWEAYKNQLEKRLGRDNKLLRALTDKAKRNPKRVVFAEGANFKVLKAAQTVLHEGIAIPILLGNPDYIKKLIDENDLDLDGVSIINWRAAEERVRREEYAKILFRKRNRKGLTYSEAVDKMTNRNYFGAMMVETGEADAFISGSTSKYADTIRPAIQTVGIKSDINHIAGMYLLMTKQGPIFFSDTTVNPRPDAQTLVDTTLLTAEAVRKFNIEPVIAMVSYSNFGSIREGSPVRVQQAVEQLHHEHPELIVDGDIQMNFALNPELRTKMFPFSKLGWRKVNTIIFPNLSSGNIAYKMMQEIGGAEAIGPILLGMNKSIHIVPLESSVREIVNMVTIAVVDAQ
ncbi:NADP-dependent malic enzyme [Marinifilum caeruleilacunae]|uniref:NADP-dependent malic enzyme n=1 Tax=Marinifilum caeruleilacunae TaxID=2499076 RepID=A0ABX1WT62_9BACT|nr:NADP-dependent malic enzyme [Marinifilum caeruleilacunae]NOU59267.1 NADP-dependent malic enzyme [Marinifilum caeruleilacunae]